MTTAVHVLDVLYLDRGGRQCNMKLLLLSEQIWKTKSNVPSLLAEQMGREHVYREGDPFNHHSILQDCMRCEQVHSMTTNM